MPHLLHLDSSADPRHSSSREVTAAFLRGWRGRGPGFTVTSHDLHADPPPHLPDAALHWAPRLRTAGEVVDPAAEARQRHYLDELMAADVLLVGAPMYNWSLPSTLKAWIDHVHVLGTTVPFGDYEARPLAGRSAVVVSSRGASYDAEGEQASWDHTVPPLELVLGRSFGMTVSVITLQLTLADRVPAMADLRGRAAAEADAARSYAEELAERIG
ncbi:NAD(P)H-dependent oxidoreductase [Modestobacter sp. VKM Ac-2986]|jgi:FMN-dependent NADH-azoreductase|uniref:FMN-dependent NADH-azoreductase n=1 Tax=Modestobacter sp. VKM Ac-2986 TaxID=3004140 RepID=UPI0022AA2971|nr:NAD(P)H-dependent oxidoreductase [Modestobacter sp. VKM Ac-2986]MCZ2827539.1 NAD(P)H-dependent oxidoreductase [Modestobacter sp. VKM Ac-2986]